MRRAITPFSPTEARQLHRKLRVYRRLQLRLRNRVSNSFAEHDGIVAAILAGNGELTDERLRKTLLIQGERFGDLVASIRSTAD
jgi:DNA-binding GntR family transcriptional regulator